MMTTFWLLASCCFAAGDGGAIWLESREAPQGIQVPAEAAYTVWAWCSREPGEVTLGQTKLAVPAADEKAKKDWTWRKAGEAALAAGPLEAALSANVATIALSTDSDFNPEQAVLDRKIFDTPRATEDRRAKTAKHTNTVFMMPEFVTVAEWEGFANVLRRRILLSSGLWPLPEKTPLNPRIFDRTQHDDYSVEKVHFEAFPGFLVTGNLYRPVGDGPFPGIVCPHGHWSEGRLADEVERGGVPSRCITLARLGAVVFSYDMIGYVDSKQFPHNWGGEKEKLWALHPFAMQLWSSIRAVDFIASLPAVDPERLGCTGASGGGTQTFSLEGIDPRIKVGAPVNMISSRMQGGCLCENAPILRLENSNMEVGALMAPRPMLMVSATGDWTRETPRVEYPAIRSIYTLYSAQDHVKSVQIDAGHNYNQASREAMYRFFAKWLLGRNDCEDFTEPPYVIEPAENLRVFPGDGPPEGYPSQEEILAAQVKERKERAARTLAKNKALYNTTLADIMDAKVPCVNDLACERFFSEQREGYVLEGWLIGRKCAGDAIPALFYRGYGADPQDAVLLVHGQGKAALADPAGHGPGPLVEGLISRGKAVLLIDAFLTGEASSPFAAAERYTEGGFMDTFQPTDTGYRVQDILTARAFLRARRDITPRIHVAGLGDAGLWALFAEAIERPSQGKTLIDWNGFNEEDDDAWVAQYYVPCIRSVGDVKLALAGMDPARVSVMNTQGAAAPKVLGPAAHVDPLPLDGVLQWLN